jgi:hypothetical protein
LHVSGDKEYAYGMYSKTTAALALCSNLCGIHATSCP